jgi:NTE family protein
MQVIAPNVAAQNASGEHEKRPKLGLVLSGGGAKGMAHVGVLKILEELNLRPDYITGTSMGSVVGGLYAIGYSADEIEHMLVSQNWSEVLSNDVNLTDVSINEKDQYGQYFVEFPIQGREISLPKGLIFGQRVMKLLSHYTLPAHSITNFDSLPIPFKCIGTDISNADAVLLDTGSLALAMRASMSIPTVFTPVMWGNRLIVDGGLRRNFPVQEVIDMGADIVIGSYTGAVLKSGDELNSVLDIIGQTSFFMGVFDAIEQRKLVDIYIEPKLDKYNASDFNNGKEIIAKGKEAALKKYDKLQDVAKILNTTKAGSEREKLTTPETLVVKNIVLRGIQHKQKSFVLARLGIRPYFPFSIAELENGIDRVYGTRYFYRLHYTFEQNDDNEKVLVLQAVPRPTGFIGVSAHYDSEKRAALLLNGTFRDFLLPSTRLSLVANISENPGFMVDYFVYLGKERRYVLGAQFNNDAFKVPLYVNGDMRGLYKYNYVSGDAYLRYALTNDSRLVASYSLERTVLKPKLITDNEFIKWQLKNQKASLGYEINTLNRRYFPTTGLNLSVCFAYHFDMNYSIDLGDTLPSYSNKRLFNKTMGSLIVHMDHYQNILPRFTLHSYAHAGLTMGENFTLVKQFQAGGLFTAYSYLIPFVGFNELEYTANQIITGGAGIQYEPFKNFFIEPRANLMLSENYIEDYIKIDEYEFILGYGLQLGYSTLIGPVLISVGSNTYNEKWRAFFNIGYRFRF